MIKAYILDDEKNARLVLEDKINIHCPDIKVIGSSSDPYKALKEVTELKPDLLFLDIAMPGMNGFDFLDNLPGFEGEVVFVTAFNEFAVQAFKMCALGYLLKPVNNQELINTVDSFKERKEKYANQSSRLDELIKLSRNGKIRLAIPTQQGYAFSNIDDIIRCEGSEKYTIIYTTTKKLISTRNIGYYVDILGEYDFYPTHKSHLINMDQVESYDRDGLVILKNGDQVPVSRRRKTDFISQFV